MKTLVFIFFDSSGVLHYHLKLKPGKRSLMIAITLTVSSRNLAVVIVKHTKAVNNTKVFIILSDLRVPERKMSDVSVSQVTTPLLPASKVEIGL